MKYDYKTAVELLQLCAAENISIAEVVVRGEMELNGGTREAVIERMTGYYTRMKTSVHNGLQISERSGSGLSGGDARKLLHTREPGSSILGNAFERSLAYGLAVLETNAAFGQVVATPTAGSAGIAPACLLTWQEERGSTDEATALGLFSGAGIGKVIGHGACFSGAQGGCQAEIGSACSMAAAALCELEGGSPEQAVQAAAIALKNTLGLICDPIGGYVEAPCTKRNGMYTLHAFGASWMALCGVKSVVPFDEVVGALREIGRKMPSIYKETAQGGLATTPTGLKLEAWKSERKG